MTSTTPIDAFLTKHRISQVMVAKALEISASSVHRKLAGERPWKLDEVHELREFVSFLLERPVSFDELLGSELLTVAHDIAG